MGKSLAEKIIETHLIEQNENELCLKVNQTLTQDTTGTMAYLQLEAMGIDKVATDLSVAYVDHNTLQTFTENADDHEYIRTVANKYGILYSKAGNGICHQVHLERFATPGGILIGSDSHTPTAGGIGMIAIGAGGLDVAVGMATGMYYIKKPKIMNIILTGVPPKQVTAKDIILSILKTLTVKGGVGYIIEYTGDGIRSLDVPDRAVLTNMGAELGATTSLFPSDDITRIFLKRQNRENDYIALSADDDAIYDSSLEIDLSKLEPMVALPHSPDNVVTVKEVEGRKVNQVAIGSCTNASFNDLMTVATLLKGKVVASHVSLTISPGSSNVLAMLSENGALSDMITAGARILEPSCGPCIGMGQSPLSNGVSLRTFNRNFKGRCGTSSTGVYLVSPMTATLSAIAGEIVSPTTEVTNFDIELPELFKVQDHFFIYPNDTDKNVVMGPNIKPVPDSFDLYSFSAGNIVLKTGDNITTDDIVPSTSSLLPYRSNVPYLSDYCFVGIDPDFPDNCRNTNNPIIIGGKNYGQGSSREHAALVPLQLGVKAVIAKSFARIHKSNLINSGIVPLIFSNESDYDFLEKELSIEFVNLAECIKNNETIVCKSGSHTFSAYFDGTDRERKILLNKGYLNYVKSGGLKHDA